jgi:hypothetical protein
MNHSRELVVSVCIGWMGASRTILSLPVFGMDHFPAENTVASESRCALVKDVGFVFQEPQGVKTESNSYTLYRYCTATAV